AVKSAGKALKPRLTSPTRPSPQSSTHGSPANDRIAQPAGNRMEKPLVSSTKSGPSSESRGSFIGAGEGLVAGSGLPLGPRTISEGRGTSVSSGADIAGAAADALVRIGTPGRAPLDPAAGARGLAPFAGAFSAAVTSVFAL